MVGGGSYNFAYSYMLTIGLKEMTYTAVGTQAARKVNYDYYASGRVRKVRDGGSTSTTMWVHGDMAYWPSGARKTMTLGNGVVEESGVDARQRMTSRKASKAGTTLMELGLTYYANGNVNTERRTSGMSGQAMDTTNTFGYDGLNRLSTVSGTLPNSTTWSQGYGFDRWGNRWVSAYSGIPPVTAAPRSADQYGTNNRLVKNYNGVALPGTPYDEAGNLVSHPEVGTITYDGESRMVGATTVGVPPQTATYAYDGEGRRVKRTVGADTTIYIHDAFGQVASEVGLSEPSAKLYATRDHLGSTRLLTDASGAMVRCYDYLPVRGGVVVVYRQAALLLRGGLPAVSGRG